MLHSLLGHKFPFFDQLVSLISHFFSLLLPYLLSSLPSLFLLSVSLNPPLPLFLALLFRPLHSSRSLPSALFLTTAFLESSVPQCSGGWPVPAIIGASRAQLDCLLLPSSVPQELSWVV